MVQENVMNVLQIIVMELNVKKHAHHFAMDPIYLFVIDIMGLAFAPLAIFLIHNALNVKKDIIIKLEVVIKNVLKIVRKMIVIKMMGLVTVANMVSGIRDVNLNVMKHVKLPAFKLKVIAKIV
jgi:hypothetical protein